MIATEDVISNLCSIRILCSENYHLFSFGESDDMLKIYTKAHTHLILYNIRMRIVFVNQKCICWETGYLLLKFTIMIDPF